MKKLLEIWNELLKVIDYAKKLDLYNYPSVLTLLERERDRWFEDSARAQILYKDLPSVKDSYKPKLDIYGFAKEFNFPEVFFPNVCNFKVLLGPLCWIYALFGYSKRTTNIMLFRNYKNGSINRRLFYKFYLLYLFKKHGDYKNYWRISELILKDKDYLLSVFHKTHPAWYKKFSLSKVYSILSEVELIMNTPTSKLKINFKRVYIPKANGKNRPLGVPTLSWRVYLSMLNNVLSFVRVDTPLVSGQHGYLKSRSLLTAWEEIFGSLEKFDYVYEFDLKGFFDNVPLETVDLSLKRNYGMNKSFRDRLLALNRSICTLEPVDKIVENDRLILLNSDGTENVNKFYDSSFSFCLSRYWTWICQKSTSRTVLPKQNISLNWPSLETLDTLFNPECEEMVKDEDLPIPSHTFDVDDRKIVQYKVKGIPQGAATSPTLSTLCLDQTLLDINSSKESKIIMYADDGLIFSKTRKGIESCKEALSKIVAINENKSSYVKIKKFIKELKFCGLVYLLDGSLVSRTRSGTEFNFGIKEQFLAYLKENISKRYSNFNKKKKKKKTEHQKKKKNT